MSSDPSLPVSIEAVRELPEEIARAIEAFEDAAQEHGWEAGSGSAENTARAANDRRIARNALATAILSRLTAAERACDSYARENQQLSDRADAALARVERLEKALCWYVENDDVNLSDPENQFWIDGYNQARAALSSPAATEEG